MNREGFVYYNKKFAGTLTEHESGLFTFLYDPLYLKNNKNFPISLTMPMQETPYESMKLFPFFDGLIPEGWLLNLTSKNWKLNPRDRMGLLLVACQDCIGAVSVFDTKQGFR